MKEKKKKKISYLINFESLKQREEFKKLLGIVRYKSYLEVTEVVIEALRSFEKGLKKKKKKTYGGRIFVSRVS